jgi:hypothetical protein
MSRARLKVAASRGIDAAIVLTVFFLVI